MQQKKMFCVFFFILLAQNAQLHAIPMYFCTAANSTYFPLLLNLIGSIHNTNFNSVQEIAVFDIGLTSQQRQQLKKIEKVSLHEVERVNKDIITPIDCRPNKPGGKVPGAYSWKHVVCKQALDMFPYVLYIDAGALIHKPLDIFFEYLLEKGYFFRSGDKKIGDRITNYVRDIFNLDSKERAWIPKGSGLESNFMGFTHKVYDSLVMPMYELAKDLKAFIPDDTVPIEYRSQSLYSIQVRILGLEIAKSPYHLQFKNKRVPFDIVFIPKRNSTYVQICRWRNKKDYAKCIQYKK